MGKPCCKMLDFEVSLKHMASTYCFVFLKRKTHKPPCLVWLSLLGAAFHGLEIMILFLFNLDTRLKVVEFYKTGVWMSLHVVKVYKQPKHSHEHTQSEMERILASYIKTLLHVVWVWVQTTVCLSCSTSPRRVMAAIKETLLWAVVSHLIENHWLQSDAVSQSTCTRPTDSPAATKIIA